MKNLKSKNHTTPFKKTLTLHQYGGLDYVTIIHIPVFKFGNPYPSPEFRPQSKINKAVAKAILKKNICIQGRELRFLRKDVLQFSLEQFSMELNLSSVAVFHWEKTKTAALHPINELAVRALVAEKLNLNIKLRLRKDTQSTVNPPKIRISAKNLVKFNDGTNIE